MSMEKISKEELLNKLGVTSLSDDELEMVTGGDDFLKCLSYYEGIQTSCKAECDGDSPCEYECEKAFADNLPGCLKYA